MLQTIKGVQHLNPNIRGLITLGRISVLVAVLCAGSLVFIPLLSDFDSSDYSGNVYRILSAQEKLPMVMLFAGLWLTGATAITTWFIALYSSFRVAGPLFRFARNIEIKYKAEGSMTLNIRSNDRFQKESSDLLASMHSVNSYYEDIHNCSDDLLKTIVSHDKGESTIEEVNLKLSHLQMLVERANLETA